LNVVDFRPDRMKQRAALVILKEKTYIVFIGFWPDNRVVSLLALPGARSDFLTITSTNRV
jgi:hypothetical protein